MTFKEIVDLVIESYSAGKNPDELPKEAREAILALDIDEKHQLQYTMTLYDLFGDKYRKITSEEKEIFYSVFNAGFHKGRINAEINLVEKLLEDKTPEANDFILQILNRMKSALSEETEFALHQIGDLLDSQKKDA